MSKVLLDQEKIATSITGAIAFRIRYRSQDLNGVATESTGVVVAPEDTSAERNVISWTHGTTGTGDAACPSAQPDPARELTLYYTYGSQTHRCPRRSIIQSRGKFGKGFLQDTPSPPGRLTFYCKIVCHNYPDAIERF